VITRRLDLLLWIATCALAALAAIGWRRGVPEAPVSRHVLLTAPRALRHIDPDSLSAAASAVAAGDPFRLDRHPATVAYRPELDGTPPPSPPPKPPHPVLALAGIVGGPPWEALLSGVPGRDGTVLVRKGDTLGDLKVRAVGRDTVVVQGADTTWKLTLVRPWQ
jgi:hypothetical protein